MKLESIVANAARGRVRLCMATAALACGLLSAWADTVTWTGGSGNWSEAANWQKGAGGSGVPAAGDDVVISTGVTVTLDGASSTPSLKSLTVGGGAAETKLLFTKWDAAVVATTVTVAKQGVLTCQGAYEKSDMGRVWVKCTTLTVASGGKIDVSECGYLAAEKPAVGQNINGYGPGAAVSYGMGASHGGLGGIAVLNGQSNGMTLRAADFSDMLYDDPAAPVEPGSSGRSSGYAKGSGGGGAVRIEASGRVTVDGSILATGGGQVKSAYWIGNSHGTCGSGGSVYITCDTLAGSGAIRADGGNGHYALYYPMSGSTLIRDSIYGYDHPQSYGDEPGGGGMVAIHYTAAKQTANLVSGMTISAGAGLFGSFCRCPQVPTRSQDDRYFCHADLGTLHFTDGTLVTALLGKGLSGQVLGFSEWTCDNLDFTSGDVRFIGEGFRFRVNGNLTVSGTNVRLDFGATVTNRVFRSEVWAGRELVQIEVGGNLTVADGGRLDIRAAETNAVNTIGTVVTVGKTLTVAKDGWLYAWCDPVNGASPKFSVANLTVAEGGVLSAEGRGFAGAVGRNNGDTDRYWNCRVLGYGPTCGFGNAAGIWASYTFPDGTTIGAPATGGSHGGLGGLSSIGTGTKYARYVTTGDDDWRPTLPGSGGGAEAMSYGNGAGGGVIYVEAADHIQVDGTVNADGGRVWSLSGSGSGGAGGTIFLSGKTFSGASTGVLTARGGDIGYESRAQASGAGGGGRIAVWTGREYPGKMSSKRISKYTSPEGCPGCSFLGTTTAGGGVNDVSSLPETTGATLNGADGTVRFAYVSPSEGLGIIFY